MISKRHHFRNTMDFLWNTRRIALFMVFVTCSIKDDTGQKGIWKRMSKINVLTYGWPRLWWSIALTISLLTCCYFIYKVYRKWDETPVIVTFSEKSTPIWDIPFPAVTICSETKVDRKIANYTDIMMKLNQTDFEPPFNVTNEEYVLQTH